MANACLALKSVATAKWLTLSDGKYQLNADNASAATPFYFKASNLGEYMLYADNETLLKAKAKDATGFSNASFALSSLAAPADQPSWDVNHGVLWTLEQDEQGFYFTARAHDPRQGANVLAVDGSNLVVADKDLSQPANQRFSLEQVNHCAQFPELSSDTIGDTYKGNGEDQPVIGFSDIHSHFGATDFLGEARVGAPFSQYGVTSALRQADFLYRLQD